MKPRHGVSQFNSKVVDDESKTSMDPELAAFAETWNSKVNYSE